MVSLIALLMLFQSAPVTRDGLPLQFQHPDRRIIDRCLSRNAPERYDVNLLCRVTRDARLVDCQMATDRMYPRDQQRLAQCLARGMSVVYPEPYVDQVVPVHLFGGAR